MAESYPAFRAGQKVTGELLASMLPRTVRKTSDTARTSTTPSADPELQITVEANAVYRMDGILYVFGSVDTDIQVDWSAPTGSDGSWGASGLAETENWVGALSPSNVTNGKLVGTTTITSARAYGVDDAGAGSPTAMQVQALLITGSTAGTYSLDWSVQSGEVGTVTVMTDSYFTLVRIA